MAKYDLPYSIDYLGSYRATLGPMESMGPTPQGLKVNVYITGGEVFGSSIQGEVLPVGGDRFNRLFCLGIDKISADLSEIIYDIYAVR